MEAKGFTSFLFISLLALSSVYKLGFADGATKTWCVANPSTDDKVLIQNINYACNEANVGCTIIQQGGACYSPNSNISHASVVMNLYYQSKGGNQHNCYFNGSGLISRTDPSYGSCSYKFGA